MKVRDFARPVKACTARYGSQVRKASHTVSLQWLKCGGIFFVPTGQGRNRGFWGTAPLYFMIAKAFSIWVPIYYL